MNLRITGLGFLFLLSLLAVRTATAQAVYYTPITAPLGFTDDVIADGARPALISTTASTDQGQAGGPRYCFQDSTYRSPVAGQTSANYLPTGRRIRSTMPATINGLPTYPVFYLQPAGRTGAFTSNNSLRIAGTGTGSLTLPTPLPTEYVMVAATTGNGVTGTIGSTVTMRVVFTDGSSETFARDVPDWFNGITNIVVGDVGRVDRDTDLFFVSAGNPKIYHFVLQLSVPWPGQVGATRRVQQNTACWFHHIEHLQCHGHYPGQCLQPTGRHPGPGRHDHLPRPVGHAHGHAHGRQRQLHRAVAVVAGRHYLDQHCRGHGPHLHGAARRDHALPLPHPVQRRAGQ